MTMSESAKGRSDNPSFTHLKTAFQEYSETNAPVTFLLMGVIGVVFVSEMTLTVLFSLDRIQIFASGIFGVHPRIAWFLSPVLHRDILHFVSSLVGLVVVGIPIENHWDWRRYSVFLVLTGYFSIGFGALGIGLFTEQQIAFYGASGIIYALGGFALTHLWEHHKELNLIEQFAIVIGAIVMASVIIDPFTGPFFDPYWINGAHTSGFVIGAIIGWFGLGVSGQ